MNRESVTRHNPYFNRWFSAMHYLLESIEELQCHNPYFNRWFSAIYQIGDRMVKTEKVTILILIDGFLQSGDEIKLMGIYPCHNPYFNRWFSAIKSNCLITSKGVLVTILILIDGFLQFVDITLADIKCRSQSLF